MSTPSKISVYSLPDLKNTTDDALPNYLNSLKFRQDHFYADVRLALGYTAVTIAGALFAYDYKFGWSDSKPYTLPAVVAYFVLNSAFMYWTAFVEKGTMYVGERQGAKLVLSTSCDKRAPVYRVTAKYRARGDSAWRQADVKAPFTRWFSSDGFFVPKPFQQWLASNVPVVGEADPSNVVEDIGRGSAQEAGGQFNVGLSNLPDVLNSLKSQGQPGKARRRA